MGEHHEEKRRLRHELRAARTALTDADAAERSKAICERVLALPLFSAAEVVVAYVPRPDEVDPRRAIAAAEAAGKAVFYPRVVSDGLEFLTGGRLRPGWRGLLEPEGGVALRPPGDGALMLVPGVGFDERGMRLGRGGGAYDRALGTFAAATRIGLAFECQVRARLPSEAWDVRMHSVATETRLLGATVTKEMRP